jgi:hypothetical protein
MMENIGRLLLFLGNEINASCRVPTPRPLQGLLGIKPDSGKELGPDTVMAPAKGPVGSARAKRHGTETPPPNGFQIFTGGPRNGAVQLSLCHGKILSSNEKRAPAQTFARAREHQRNEG